MDDAKRRLEGIDEKMNLVIGFFRTLVTPEQQELGALIARKAGPRAVMRNNDTLKELIKFKSGTRAHSGKPVDSEKAERKCRYIPDLSAALRKRPRWYIWNASSALWTVLVARFSCAAISRSRAATSLDEDTGQAGCTAVRSYLCGGVGGDISWRFDQRGILEMRNGSKVGIQDVWQSSPATSYERSRDQGYDGLT